MPLVIANDISHKVLNGIETCNALVLEKAIYQRSKNVVFMNANRPYKTNRLFKVQMDGIDGRVQHANGADITENKWNLQLPKEIYNAAKFLERDPDPEFSGEENWYYNNCIVAKNILNTPCIIAARGIYNNDLDIIPLSVNKDTHEWYSKETQIHRCSLNNLQPVMQLVATRRGLIGVRKKSTIFVLKLEGLEEHSLSTTLVLTLSSTKYPYTSIDLHKRELIVTNTARQLQVYNVKSSRPKLEGMVRKHEGCSYDCQWNSVAYARGSPGVAMFADICGVSAVDLSSPSLNFIDKWCTRQYFESCERVTLVQQSSYDLDLWYLATTHHVFGLKTSKSGESAFLFRVSHFMAAVPLYCTLKRVDNNETLVLGDQACNQPRSIIVKWDPNGPKPSVSSLANYVNTPLDTLAQARERGQLLRSCVTKRFNNNLAGLTFLPTPDKSPDPVSHHAHRRLTLFSLRSSGDVFHQDMTQEPLLESEDSSLNRTLDPMVTDPVEEQLQSAVNGNGTDELSNTRRPNLNESMDLFSSQMEEDTSRPDLNTSEQSEQSRSHSDLSRCVNRGINNRELDELKKWEAQLDEGKMVKPMLGANVEKFPDIFSDLDLPQLPLPQPEVLAQSLESALSDLSLSGINSSILKLKDPILECVTCWSDDSSDGEQIDFTRQWIESIDDDVDLGISTDIDSCRENLNTIGADTLNELYVESDSEGPASTTYTVMSRLNFNSKCDPDDPKATGRPSSGAFPKRASKNKRILKAASLNAHNVDPKSPKLAKNSSKAKPKRSTKATGNKTAKLCSTSTKSPNKRTPSKSGSKSVPKSKEEPSSCAQKTALKSSLEKVTPAQTRDPHSIGNTTKKSTANNGRNHSPKIDATAWKQLATRYIPTRSGTKENKPQSGVERRSLVLNDDAELRSAVARALEF